MNRTLKYTLWAVGIGLITTALAVINADTKIGPPISLSIPMIMPGYLLVKWINAETLWNDSLEHTLCIISALSLNTIVCVTISFILASISPLFSRQHRQRIKRWGIKTAIITCILSIVFFVVWMLVPSLATIPYLRISNYAFIWLGFMQAWYLWGDTFKTPLEAYAYGMLFGIPINTLLGFGLGCLIAAFTSSWAKLPIRHGCPKCGYDLTGTPEHCPECGWKKAVDAKTNANA
ncbi:MAG TPA: hypothetical protein DCM28_23775 [Phycisphaerales bacterium]|nr:hypothetical protein [Phycisphaerales bacterium]HCD34176.1 hypothetical protein [Phycisphaerales bacterium]|tara:strand:- start:506 stop:1207 length:702 start_codon:yes stop_codon:yes gene_type:complete